MDAAVGRLPHYYTSSHVVPHGERAGHADAGRHRGRAAGLPDGPGPGRLHNQPNHLGAGGVPFGRRPGHGNGLEHRSRAAQLLHHRTSRRPPYRQARSHGGGLGAADSALSDDGGADEVVAAIGEQILGPHGRLAVKLDGSPRLQRGPGHAERGRPYADPGGEPVEHRAHLQLDPGPLPPRPPSSWCTCPRQTTSATPCTAASWATRAPGARPRCTSPPNGVAKLHFGAHFQASLETGNAAQEDTAASALLLKHEFLDGGAATLSLLTTLGNFLVRSNSQSSMASASFTVGGFQLEGYAMTLSAFVWNIART